MSSARAFSGTYSPGGHIHNAAWKRERARVNGRKGGFAAGVTRRQLARGRRDTHDGGLGVPKAYAPVPWLSRAHTEQVFRSLCAEDGRRFHRGGYESFDAVYRILKRWSIAKGQDFEITNENVSAALLALERPHSRRTVQYVRARLVRAEVLTCAHVKRSGARRTPGAMDTIRVRIRRVALSKHCTPPLRGTPQRSSVASWGVCAPEEKEDGASKASDPPASPADEIAADAAENDSSDDGGAWARFIARRDRRHRAELFTKQVAGDELAKRRQRNIAPPPGAPVAEVRKLRAPQGLAALQLAQQRAVAAARKSQEGGDWWG